MLLEMPILAGRAQICSMNEELQTKLECLKFQPHEPEGMTVRIDDVHFTAVVHPLKGLALLVSHRDSRSISQFEIFISTESSIQEIAYAMTRAYEQIHPEKKAEVSKTPVNIVQKEVGASKSRQERANSFIGHAKLFAVGSWKPFLELKPHLWQAISERGHKELTFEEKCFKWDFFLIVAMTWWAVNSAKIELPEAAFKDIADTLERQIAGWNRGAIAGFSDLNRFIQEYELQYQKMVKPREVLDFTKLLVGTWLLWNLTDKAKFDDEAEAANMLGNLVYKCIAGYWNDAGRPSH